MTFLQIPHNRVILGGQLVFYDVKMAEKNVTPYKGRYDCPTEAGLPQFFARDLDDDMAFWGGRASG
jgi:hypothetical protein